MLELVLLGMKCRKNRVLVEGSITRWHGFRSDLRVQRQKRCELLRLLLASQIVRVLCAPIEIDEDQRRNLDSVMRELVASALCAHFVGILVADAESTGIA